MPDAATLFWLRIQRRAASVSPELSRALLKAYETLRARMTGAEAVAFLANNLPERFVTAILSDPALEAAFAPFRSRLVTATADATAYFAKDVPKAGILYGTQAVAFDVLNPRVLQAIRDLDTKVIQGLKDNVRETVRQAISRGMTDGLAPRTTARALRNVLGLAPNQEAAVVNFERLLRAKDADALTRALRDKRFDATLKKALGPGGTGLSEAQIEKMATAYRKRMVAFNAETHARTATLDAQKLGQSLAWEDAREKGLIPDGYALMKSWHGVLDDREREEHVAMEGETVRFDEPYSNGEVIPGESSWNCRCLSAVFTARDETAVAA